MTAKVDNPLSPTSELHSKDIDIEAESLLGLKNNGSKRSSSGRRFPWLFLHIGIILFYSLLFFWLTHYNIAAPTYQPMLYSPASAVIQQVTKPIDESGDGNIYVGEPNGESDAAWRELLSNINLRITPQELKMLNQTSVELPDGGYLASLGVYHQLHCVKRLRKYLYMDYYYPNRTTVDEADLKFHASHCIEQLRQAVMCHGDVTMTSFEFRSSDSQAIVRSESLHQCVAWEPLRDWASERRVDLQYTAPENTQ